MRFLKVLSILVLVVVVSTIAYAETQSVKVSGDITLRSFARNNYDLENNEAVAATTTGLESTDWATHLMSTAEVEVDTDMTDNVAATVRLINQREWGDGRHLSNNAEVGSVGLPARDQFTGAAINPGTAASFDVSVDLAYIELKEFLYSPLTLKIGRQDLWFGRGFIVGANLQSPNGAIFAQEYTAISSFDAVRATVDYAPWTLDAVFAKIAENGRRADDDLNLWGINGGYDFDVYNAEAEAYWWFKQQRYAGGATTVTTFTTAGESSNDVHTLGARGSFEPLEDWTLALEGAYQCGEYIGVNSQRNNRNRSAYAIDAMAECRYWQDNFAWKPVLGAEYIFYSGESNLGATRTVWDTGEYSGWDPMFRGKFDTAIREFQNVYYGTTQVSCPADTNQHQILVNGCVEPTDSLTFEAKYGHFWLAEKFSTTTTNKNIGDEVDLSLTWDYTEDVSFNLLTGWFFPGSHFQNRGDDVATDIVGTVKLSF